MKAGTHKGAGRYQADRVDVRGITWNWIWSWVMSSGRSCRRFDSFSVTMRSITVRAIAGTSIATVLMYQAAWSALSLAVCALKQR